MANIYTITNIIATNTDDLLYVWSDGHKETHPADWTGFFHGSVGGHDENGEYQRVDGTDFFNNADIVLDVFLANGGVVAPYIAPSTVSAAANGAALDARQQKSAKDEAAALASDGDFAAAFDKLLEII